MRTATGPGKTKPGMILSYFKLAFRLLIRNPYFTLINVTGLSIGFVAFFALWEYSIRVLNTDRHIPGSERIARLCIDWRWTDDGGATWGKMIIGRSAPSTAYRISHDFPEVVDFVRILHRQPLLVGNLQKGGSGDGPGRILSKEDNGVYSDPNLFAFFSIPLIFGDRENALQAANSVVLSRKMATRFFGDRDPVGELLVLNDTTAMSVTGVFEDLPEHTHLDFDFAISNRGLEDTWNSNIWAATQNYLRLSHSGMGDLQGKVNARAREYFAEVSRIFPNVKAEFVLQPLREVAFSKGFSSNDFEEKSKDVLLVLAAVSVLVLLMAWINYVNLTISRISARMKEIAVRKISAAKQEDFFAQFAAEAAIFNALAVALSITILQFMRNPARELLDIHIPDLADVSRESIVFFACIICLSIAVMGGYPAYLAMRRPAGSLFQSWKKTAIKRPLPLFLTTVQYTIAVMLIFCGIIIHQQLIYILDKGRGFDATGVFMVESPIIRSGNFLNDIEVLASAFRQQPGVQGVTLSTSMLDFGIRNKGASTPVYTDGFAVSETYLPFFDIPLVAGRHFEKDDRKDAVIVSRLAAMRLGFSTPEDIIGKRIEAGYNQDWRDMEVIGVIADFRIRPFFTSDNNTESGGRGFSFVYSNKQFPPLVPDVMSVRLKGEGVQETLAGLKSAYESTFPGNVFTGSFVLDMINRPYRDEMITRNQITFFIFIAMLIACLGFLGMISNTVLEKTHEIGIRKALGANMPGIARLLLQTTFYQVVAALVIGVPLASYLSTQYLQKYSERIAIAWWHYVAPAMLLATMLVATVSFVLVKVYRTNPVDTLRYTH